MVNMRRKEEKMFIVEVSKVPALPLPDGINAALVGLHLKADYQPWGCWDRGCGAQFSFVSRDNTHDGCSVTAKDVLETLEKAEKRLAAQGLHQILQSSFWRLTAPSIWFGAKETKFIAWAG